MCCVTACDMCTTADYEDLSDISREQAAEAVSRAAEFVEMACRMLADELSKTELADSSADENPGSDHHA